MTPGSASRLPRDAVLALLLGCIAVGFFAPALVGAAVLWAVTTPLVFCCCGWRRGVSYLRATLLRPAPPPR